MEEEEKNSFLIKAQYCQNFKFYCHLDKLVKA